MHLNRIMVLEQIYEPKKVEKKWAEFWVEQKIFKWKEDKEPEKNYLIDTPPPYPYVDLHTGNFFNFTYLDILAHFKRMKGFSVLLPFGWDCHGLPAEIYIEKNYHVTAEQVGVDKFRSMCREHLLKNIEYIRKEQVQVLGISVDWEHQYVTMDDEYVKMVQESFLDMYDSGMIYRKEHPVSWCPSCHSAIADAQTSKKKRTGKFYYIKLPISEGGEITIATTRPELMPSCVAVFVNPEDKRYKKLIGKKVKIPIFGQVVEIIGNTEADINFGTGAVYHCTFGDKDDWRWVVKFHLPVKIVLDEQGKFTKDVPILEGLSVEDGRKKIIEELKKLNLIEKEENIEQTITVCERCKTPMEILVKKQWYFATTKIREQIKESAEKINWHPDFMKSRLIDWSGAALWDWVISRQRCWATPFPLWYCDKCEKVIIAKKNELPIDPLKTKPAEKCSCGGKIIPEKDVMDTWMDSSLTALRLSKWLKVQRKDRLADVRSQGEDILKTWMYYSLARCTALTKKLPFNEALINGLVAGTDGKKMSKSKGNVILPAEIIEKYSADIYRQWVSASSPGELWPIDYEEMDYSKKFINKLWNISRFVSLFETKERKSKHPADLLILNEMNLTILEVDSAMKECNFGRTLKAIRNFIWHDFADIYVELIKYRIYSENEESKESAITTLREVLLNSIKMLAPIIPFVTEEIYNNVFDSKESIHLTSWPELKEKDNDFSRKWELLKEAVSAVRKYKKDKGIGLGVQVESMTIGAPKEIFDFKEDIMGIGKIKNLKFQESEKVIAS